MRKWMGMGTKIKKGMDVSYAGIVEDVDNCLLPCS